MLTLDLVEKLSLVDQYMRYEPAEELHPGPAEPCALPALGQIEHTCGEPAPPTYGCPAPALSQKDLPVHRAVLPGGKRITLLKTLLTSACERDCNYCSFRAGRDFHRTTFKPDEMAQGFMQLFRAGIVEGLFLSSGVAGGGMRTQDRLIATAEILRFKLGFRGYLHLKIMPGAEHAQVERAMQLADRVSINLEAPNPTRLEQLAPHKTFFDELLQPLQWVDEIRRTQQPRLGWNGRWPSTTTQFVVGGVGENDLELLSTTQRLTRQAHLARAYFSGFSPVPDTPLENHPAINPWRQHRLYQASFLLRDYNFDLEDLPFTSSGNLPLETDPKQAWARDHLREAPIEINHAGQEELLRIPGIGPKGARAIVIARRKHKLLGLGDLQALGIIANRAAPYILINGKKLPQQARLF
ncbi:MAG: radical SAM protein [Chloroflexi bacterium]|nr:radical SAM protein [Chloroflexota bacterium]